MSRPQRAAPVTDVAARRAAVTRAGGVDGRQMGTAAHRLIAELLEVGVREPTPLFILEHVARHPVLQGRAVLYRQAAKQTLASALAVYFRYFAPAERWRLLGSEVAVGSCRFDLLFDVGGVIVADELKSGRLDGADAWQALERQLERELCGGRERWGDAFGGVRVLVLGAPRRSFLAAPEGTREPLPCK